MNDMAATELDTRGISPVATSQLLRLGAIDQGVGGAGRWRGREGFTPDHRSLWSPATARPGDLVLAGVGSRLARAQTFGVLAHVGHLVSVPGNTWVEKKPPTGGRY